eukprot:jgi/Tetstr1/444641/TSEL_032489.t1
MEVETTNCGPQLTRWPAGTSPSSWSIRLLLLSVLIAGFPAAAFANSTVVPRPPSASPPSWQWHAELPPGSACAPHGDKEPLPGDTSATARHPGAHLNSSATTLRFLGLGSGTTGTRSLMKLFCEYGIPSIHSSRMCHLDPETAELHAHLRDSMWCLRKGGAACMSVRGIDGARCTLGVVRARVRKNLENLVRHGSMQAVFDVPFPQLADALAEIVPDALLLQSMRDGPSWAESRYTHHVDSPVCRDGVHNPLDVFNCGYDTDPCHKLLYMRDLNSTQKEELGQRMFYERHAHIRSLFPRRNIRMACAWDDGYRSVELQLRSMGYRRVSGSSELVTDGGEVKTSVKMQPITDMTNKRLAFRDTEQRIEAFAEQEWARFNEMYGPAGHTPAGGS